MDALQHDVTTDRRYTSMMQYINKQEALSPDATEAQKHTALHILATKALLKEYHHVKV